MLGRSKSGVLEGGMANENTEKRTQMRMRLLIAVVEGMHGGEKRTWELGQRRRRESRCNDIMYTISVILIHRPDFMCEVTNSLSCLLLWKHII